MADTSSVRAANLCSNMQRNDVTKNEETMILVEEIRPSGSVHHAT